MQKRNQTIRSILLNALLSAVALFINGFGVYLTIHADLGSGPWDVFSQGLSGTLGILYGTASIAISFLILLIDVLMKEPIGIAMIIDALVVGKTVDLFNFLDFVPIPKTLPGGCLMIFIGLFIMAYTQWLYMIAALGCGPRDTLLVGLKKRLKRIPIGPVSIALLALVTLTGWLLGGPVGIGTLICAFGTGPIIQLAFHTAGFDPTTVRHQRVGETFRVIRERIRKKQR